jgi:predicted transcriptional regulator
MTLTISLPPEMEAKLRDRAAATGKDFSTLVREAVEEKLAVNGGGSTSQEKPYDLWLAEFSAWMQAVTDRGKVYPPGFVVDDSRESIYGDRG